MADYMHKFMEKTIEIASTNPIAPYGAIIVYEDSTILAQSVNDEQNDPIMHGELSVIHKLFSNHFVGERSKLSLYTTAEPCPMCSSAIYWAMIPKVIYGTSIPFLHHLFGSQIQVSAAEIFSKTPDFYNCTLIGGVMEEQCNHLFIEAKKLLDRSID